ncbi:hypothetical protein [Flavobacterium sp.]|uniref:hypothetical protein n=1 Tax=Flavobacterium sp. TaxID=239 RepID=UPI0022C22F97|nr:hypothetical protein [Flavobacterium sp.]MCZ8168836.1 hypothetical protein [Flavobacterium sp.]
MFQRLKDHQNSYTSVTYNYDSKDVRSKKKQIEDYDSEILCSECDNGIIGSIYESYAKNVIYGKDLKNEIGPQCDNYISDDGTEYMLCTNIDYKKLKLFLLSLLWRASITKQHPFEDVSIGTKHEERIRKLILNGISTAENEYPILISSFANTKTKFEKVIFNPRRVIMPGKINAYSFIIDSLQYHFIVVSRDHNLPEYIKDLNLKSNGELVIAFHPYGSDIQYINRFLKN